MHTDSHTAERSTPKAVTRNESICVWFQDWFFKIYGWKLVSKHKQKYLLKVSCQGWSQKFLIGEAFTRVIWWTLNWYMYSTSHHIPSLNYYWDDFSIRVTALSILLDLSLYLISVGWCACYYIELVLCDQTAFSFCVGSQPNTKGKKQSGHARLI